MESNVTKSALGIKRILFASLTVIAASALCSCSGSVAEDEIESDIEQIKNVSTEICGSTILVNVNTNKKNYTTTLNNIKGVDVVNSDTIVVNSSADVVPGSYYLSTKNHELNSWKDGNFDHKEILKSFVVCFADGQTASLNFKQDNVRFMSTQMPTPELEESEPILVCISEDPNATDNDEFIQYICTYSMKLHYEGMEGDEVLLSNVVVLQRKDAINFNGGVNDYESEHNDTEF